MKAIIKKQALSEEFYTPERCYITELSNTQNDLDASIARARVEPGITTRWHRLKNISERYCIISGQGQVEVGQLPPQQVNTGDTVLIPPMCRQRITKNGSSEMIFIDICTPRFVDEAYEDIEPPPTSG
jgi:mannose-6-phosphate isomerase-like protein (cupin superfamily)